MTELDYTAGAGPWYHEPACVYRLYTRDLDLLYVGVTANLLRRLAEHARNRNWSRHGDEEVVRVDTRWYPNWHAALIAEDHCIATERPRYNVRRRRNFPLIDFPQAA